MLNWAYTINFHSTLSHCKLEQIYALALFCSVIGDWYTAVDGWAVTLGTARRGLSRLGPRPCSPLLAVPNVTAHAPINSQCTNLSHFMWHCNCVTCSSAWICYDNSYFTSLYFSAVAGRKNAHEK